MGRFFPFRGKKSFVLIVLLALAGLGWWQRTPFLAWYYVHGLTSAGDDERERWVERAANLDTAALPNLFACLSRDDPRACVNAEAVLVRLVKEWGNNDSRTLLFAEQLGERFSDLSVFGQRCALELAIMVLRAQADGPQVPARAVQAAGRMLAAAAQLSDQGVQFRALALAEVVVDVVPQGQWGDTLREVVPTGLKSLDADCRIRAVHLTLHGGLRADTDLLAQVVPLLRDPANTVRRAAILAVGMAPKAIHEDDLLPLLHDPDPEVRRLCEAALRGRGLREDHLKLARLISDSRPSARLGVLDHLARATDLEPGAWLRRLSQDPSPAVRAAAVRAAAAQTQVDFSDRLRQMAQDDPNPTVRQLADHYWQQHVRGMAATRP
jgi:hypothetical protein